MKATLLSLPLSLLPHFAWAQEATPPTGPFVVAAGEIKLQTLIDNCAGYLGWNILVYPQELSAASPGSETRFQQRIETDTKGCQELLATMLARGGMALTVLDEPKHLYEVIAMNGPRAREIMMRAVTRTPEQVLADERLRIPVLTVVKLEHVNATIATNALRPFFASTGGAAGGSSLTLGNVGNNAAMLIAGMQDQVAQAIRMLHTCDVPQPVADDGPASLVDRVNDLERRLAAIEKQLAAVPQNGK